MPYIDIANFKYGLDSRRSELTSVPGTLQTLNNAHVNQGGEVEKRKAFARTALPANCFGLETTSTGLITFGSIADPGGWPRGAVVGFQQLQHPSIEVGNTSPVRIPTGIAYNAAYHAMTKVNFSRSFLGNIFVSATFSDGNTFLYYNGVSVFQSYTGYFYNGSPNPATGLCIPAEDMANGFNTLPWFANTSRSYPDPITRIQVISNFTTEIGEVFSPANVSFTALITKPTNASFGSLYQGAVAAYAGQASTATMTIAGSAGKTYSIALPLSPYDSATNYTQVYYRIPTITWGIPGGAAANTDAATATYIASVINGTTAVSGFSASAVGAAVSIFYPIHSDIYIDPNNATSAWNIFPFTSVPSVAVHVVSTDATANGDKFGTFVNNAQPAAGQSFYYTFGGQWSVGDSWSASVVSSNGTYTLGKGNLSIGSKTFSNGIVFNNRMYLTNNNYFNFSAVGDPTGWEQQNIGAGYLPFTSQYGTADTVQAFAPYQGRLAVFGRRSVQIWGTDANPSNFFLQQTLANIGTIAPFSVMALGEIDNFFLSDTGVRSLRVRDSSLNGYINDLGSAIDSIVQSQLQGNGKTTNACSIIEPSSNRYWLYVPDANGTSGVIYVLSYFPTNKIIAWSTYSPTYNNGGNQTQFIPQTFKVYNGQVFARDSGAVYAFGGSDGNTYDACLASMQTGYLAGGGRQERPGHWKKAKAIDFVISGTWTVKAGMDWISGTLTLVDTASKASYDQGAVPFTSDGTHFSLYAESTDNTIDADGNPPTLSSIMFHYELGQET